MTLPPDAPSPTPFPRLSEDWRFLLPIPAKGRALILCRTPDDIPRAFSRLAIRTVACFADPNVLSAPGDISSTDILVASWRRLPFTSASFDLILAPRGVPFRGVALEAALNAIRPLLRPGGALFLGVANRRSPVHRASAPSSGISPRRLKSLLRRAEYVSVEFYGVMPDLDVPEYIFPLSPYALSFALRHRYRRRLPPRWSGWFAHPLVAAFFLPFLPAWYVLARVPDESEG